MQRLSQFVLALLLGLMTVTGPIYATELPNLGDASVSSLTKKQEAKLTQEFLKMLRKQTQFIADPVVNDYLHTLGYHLAAQVPGRKKQLTFFMLKSQEINAFAGPGGYIGVFSGLFLLTKSESELAGVMAHEVAHVTQHHLARTFAEAKRMTLPSIGAMVAAVLIGAKADSPDAAIGAATAISAGVAQRMISFTRSNEQEADRVGMRIMYNARFNPHALPAMFDRMQRVTFTNDTVVPAFLQTHPVTATRLAEADTQLENYPKRKVKSGQNYYLVRARLRVLSSVSATTTGHYFRTQLDKGTYQNKPGAEYGYALALLKMRRLNDAKAIIEDLIKRHPNQMLYPMALAEVLSTQHHTAEALTILKRNHRLYPDYYPLMVQYTDLLLKTGHAHRAYSVLEEQVENDSSNAVVMMIYAQAQSATGRVADAYISRGTAIQLIGNLPLAIDQLEQALKLAGNDRDKRDMIRARIKNLQRKVLAQKRSR